MNGLALANKKEMSAKVPAISNFIGLSLDLDDFNNLALFCSEVEDLVQM
jgi:hypothetical protein